MTREYTLTERTFDNLQEGVRGIYIIGIFDGNNVTPFYVGSAENIKKRLKEHLGDSESNQCIRQKIKESRDKIYFYYEKSDALDLTLRENQLYKELSNSFKLCNKQTPKTSL